MKPSDRIAFFESTLNTFLARARDRGYITFEVTGDHDEYVQYLLRNGKLIGEVCSRQWGDPERPLSQAAVKGLARLGFTGGGPEKNFVKVNLPKSASKLATLTDSLLLAAYEPDDEFAPLLHQLNLNDVAAPRAERFTRDMIEAQLRDHDVRFLIDQDGDFRADFNCGGSDEPVTIWFIAEGDNQEIYRVNAGARHRPVPATREEAVDRCNTWNRQHRWPTAGVVDVDTGWLIATNAGMDLEPGVTKALFARFTDRVVAGTLEFWEWIATPQTADTPAPGVEQ